MHLANIKQPGSEETKDVFCGASIITETGEEIPITEQMLQQSFELLIEAWELDRRKKQN